MSVGCWVGGGLPSSDGGRRDWGGGGGEREGWRPAAESSLFDGGGSDGR